MTTIHALVLVRDREWQEVLNRFLDNHHCQVVVSTDAVEALDIAGKTRFDIVIVDNLLKNVRAPEVVLNLKDISPESTVVVLGAGLDRWTKIWRYCGTFATVPYSQSLTGARQALGHVMEIMRERERQHISYSPAYRLS